MFTEENIIIELIENQIKNPMLQPNILASSSLAKEKRFFYKVAPLQ